MLMGCLLPGAKSFAQPKRRVISSAPPIMNTQCLLLSEEAEPQAHSLASPYDTNGNAKPVIHFRRSGRSTKCGLDLHYHAAIATSKVAETTCKNCLRIHQASVALRRKASAWQRDQQQKSNDPDLYGHPLRAHIECENDRLPSQWSGTRQNSRRVASWQWKTHFKRLSRMSRWPPGEDSVPEISFSQAEDRQNEQRR